MMVQIVSTEEEAPPAVGNTSALGTPGAEDSCILSAGGAGRSSITSAMALSREVRRQSRDLIRRASVVGSQRDLVMYFSASEYSRTGVIW